MLQAAEVLEAYSARGLRTESMRQFAVEIPARKSQFMNVWQKVAETNSPPQPPGISVETRVKTPLGVLLSLRTEVQPRYIQGTISCGDVSRGIHTKRIASHTMHTMIVRVWYRVACLACWPLSVVWMRSTQGPMGAMT